MKTNLLVFVFTLALCGFTTLSFAGNVEDLVSACKKNDLAAAQKAIDAGADVNAKSADGWYPLGAAIFSPEITKLLLDKKADPNLGDSPALVNAAGAGSLEVMKLLLNAGADPNKPMIVDATATYKKLLADEKAKGKDANKFMIKAYQDLIDKAGAGTGPAVYAIQSAVNRTISNECLELLISKGAKTNVLNANSNGTLLDDLAMSALPAADWIENNKAQVTGWENMGFVLPAWYKNPDVSKVGSVDAMVKILVKAGVDINAVNNIKDTPLLTSLNRGTQTRSEVVLAFINNGADVNVEGFGYKGHALLQVAGYGFVDVLEAMLAKGADLNREFKVNDITTGQSLKGINPLMWAARNGKLDAVKYLVSKNVKLDQAAYGTSFNIKTNCLTSVKNKTALFFAIEGENLEVVKYLVEVGGESLKSKMTIDQWKKSSYHEAEMGNFIVTTQTVSCFDDKDYLPSEYAKASLLTEIADYLKSKKL
jgi:ankyrin repeat protein